MTATHCPYAQIRRYDCRRAPGSVEVDGDLQKACWQGVAQTAVFADPDSGERAHLASRAGLQWDEDFLYIGFWVDDPDVRTIGSQRLHLGWEENAAVACLAFSGATYELRLDPSGRAEALALVWKDAYQRGGHYDRSEFDLARLKPFVWGEDHKTDHARGVRWVFEGWELPGLRCAVQVDGALNDRSRLDKGWTAEIALPWEGLALLDDKAVLPPRPKVNLRLQLGRTEVIQGPSSSAMALWTWGRHGSGDLHVPECYPLVRLV
ncbi:MAG: hypothetical protein GKR89_21145 [Candidatus Latescibacteria bacterium]|nr:hypothetical protein [Candidatus Latescibacterota bacterium]